VPFEQRGEEMRDPFMSELFCVLVERAAHPCRSKSSHYIDYDDEDWDHFRSGALTAALVSCYEMMGQNYIQLLLNQMNILIHITPTPQAVS